MNITESTIPDVKLIQPHRHVDSRGWLAETWRRSELVAAGINLDWAQENLVYSAAPATLRGFHFQAPPQAQGKFILVLRGAIFDVAVDIRRGSPYFGRHVAMTIGDERPAQIWIPAGFAHAYLTLKPDTQILYRVTAPYAPESERGFRWDDPSLAVDWPMAGKILLNDRDKALPPFSTLISPFSYDKS